MNTQSISKKFVLAMAVAAGGGALVAPWSAQSAHAATTTNGTWTQTAGGSYNWSTPGDWSGGTVAGATSGTTDTGTATFSAVNSAPITITLDSTRNLEFMAFNSTGAGGYTINSNTFDLTNAPTVSTGLMLTGAGTVTINSALVLEGANYYIGNTSTAAATLNFGGQISGATGATNLKIQGTNTGANTISGNIINGGATSLNLTKNGVGTWILSGANTYTGGTVISNGILVLGTGGSLAATNAVTLGSTTNSGLFQLGDTTSAVNTTVTSLTTSGTGLTNAVVGGNAAVSTLTINNALADSFTGVLGGGASLQNNLALTKTGAGTLTLSGANTYNGTTLIKTGTLAITGSAANTASIVVGDTEADNAAILNVSGMAGGGITLGASQTLAGHGTVTGNVTGSSGTTFTPGGSIGTLGITGALDLSSGGNTLNYALGSTTNGSRIAVTTLLTLSGAANTYTLNLIDNAGANGQGSLGIGTYKLFTYGTDSGFSSAAFNVASGLPIGDSYSVMDNSPSKEIDLVIAGVPEPMSLALLGLGAVALFRRRRGA